MNHYYPKYLDTSANCCNNLKDLLFNYRQADNKIFVCKFQKMLSSRYIVNSKTTGQTVDLDEVAHYGPRHQDLRCLHIQPFLSMVSKELTNS